MGLLGFGLNEISIGSGSFNWYLVQTCDGKEESQSNDEELSRLPNYRNKLFLLIFIHVNTIAGIFKICKLCKSIKG